MGLQQQNDAKVDSFVGAVLSTGVILSFIVLVWGSILYLLYPGAPAVHRTIGGILIGAAHLNPSATVNLGLLVLLLTPVTRIIAAGIAFVMERDTKFTLISIAVLVILSISTAVGYFSGR